eukprot:TRINITY_DN1731_c0_g2_i2.p2 TRINITY_DN1731_c0_g2~~TRINITY_DN1731_c0_g2_i2.p2  ORF type:complete len:325 (+),score=0.82 TRINITY_DN1731_c0_g2_i2:200-1174(+)
MASRMALPVLLCTLLLSAATALDYPEAKPQDTRVTAAEVGPAELPRATFKYRVDPQNPEPALPAGGIRPTEVPTATPKQAAKPNPKQQPAPEPATKPAKPATPKPKPQPVGKRAGKLGKWAIQRLRAELKQVHQKTVQAPKYTVAAKVFALLQQYPAKDLADINNVTILMPSDDAFQGYSSASVNSVNNALVSKVARYNIIKGQWSYDQIKNTSHDTPFESLFRKMPLERKAVNPDARKWLVQNRGVGAAAGLVGGLFRRRSNRKGGGGAGARLVPSIPMTGSAVGFGRPNSGPISWNMITQPDMFTGAHIRVHGVDLPVKPNA